MVGTVESRIAFTALVALVAAERLFELVLAARNSRRTLGRGGIEHAKPIHRLTILVHTAWIVAAPLEVWLLDRAWLPALALTATALLVPAMVLRYWAVTTLGDRWNLRIITVPGEKSVTRGPYRFLRHPNYLAAYIELFALPLVHCAWLTAAVLGTTNLIVIRAKARAEERSLEQAAGEQAESAGERPGSSGKP